MLSVPVGMFRSDSLGDGMFLGIRPHKWVVVQIRPHKWVAVQIRPHKWVVCCALALLLVGQRCAFSGIAYGRAREWCLVRTGLSDPCSGSDGNLCAPLQSSVQVCLDRCRFPVLRTYRVGIVSVKSLVSSCVASFSRLRRGMDHEASVVFHIPDVTVPGLLAHGGTLDLSDAEN
ncbi:hypothetical protein MIMGU_mgv11b022523mg [Erythranthe guttata]|uniref:Uncharacterized protein n=1 Tax=Erythranthe guttata TaxID=4155 RepID=A0A022PX68_ERYGU|nr:hypothetical protein MIMGU_mgv11b022523mg [Erythranthe guttata]